LKLPAPVLGTEEQAEPKSVIAAAPVVAGIAAGVVAAGWPAEVLPAAAGLLEELQAASDPARASATNAPAHLVVIVDMVEYSSVALPSARFTSLYNRAFGTARPADWSGFGKSSDCWCLPR
jgi:hypothetical protein